MRRKLSFLLTQLVIAYLVAAVVILPGCSLKVSPVAAAFAIAQAIVTAYQADPTLQNYAADVTQAISLFAALGYPIPADKQSDVVYLVTVAQQIIALYKGTESASLLQTSRVHKWTARGCWMPANKQDVEAFAKRANLAGANGVFTGGSQLLAAFGATSTK